MLNRLRDLKGRRSGIRNHVVQPSEESISPIPPPILSLVVFDYEYVGGEDGVENAVVI